MCHGVSPRPLALAPRPSRKGCAGTQPGARSTVARSPKPPWRANCTGSDHERQRPPPTPLVSRGRHPTIRLPAYPEPSTWFEEIFATWPSSPRSPTTRIRSFRCVPWIFWRRSPASSRSGLRPTRMSSSVPWRTVRPGRSGYRSSGRSPSSPGRRAIFPASGRFFAGMRAIRRRSSEPGRSTGSRRWRSRTPVFSSWFAST